MTEQLTITDIGHRGDGVADTPGGAIYVPYTLPGEVVTVDKVAGHPDRRHLVHIDRPSHERVPAVCKHFGQCGGCALQHWSLAEYHLWKRSLVVEALANAGLIAPVDEVIIDAHGQGRRRAVLHARRGTHDVLEVGFTAPRAHHIVAIDSCPILAPGLNGAIKAAWAIAEILKPAQKPLDIQVTATDSGMDVDVRGSGSLNAAMTTALAKLVEAHKLARLTRHGELVAQRGQPMLTVGRAQVPLPPGSFLQATALGEDTLAKLVMEHVGKAKRVADLFAGIGTFALRLAEKARVTAADSEAGAVKALERGAQMTSGLKPVEAVARDLFRRPYLPMEMKGFDAVVFDPPRQGAEAQARELAKSNVKTIVGVSCDATTFARDANILIAGGYKLARVTAVDQFRWSHHVEMVGKFEK
ncbi:class I SAM-dependent RNA methyltransferase [Pseudolabrys taiwanensis]|uniref:Class I SAM-dependent RNA methyltransferase n=1 Tax=Pseudolabrys taiwanensis TaxID=331696 RepID=A0A345ZVM7_9HYPH|nr:class I SAM-dependent RNA methyltransferase [Pseudolabrys taiwanensis]AXK80974.1 class I SAM-dependent RNA methyltransferase [Pseudolabrys taiwanensis]